MTVPAVEKLSRWQLFVVMVTFELGSALVVGVGNDSRKDAWLALIIGAIAGLPLIWMVSWMLRLYPGQTIYSILKITLGKWIGNLLVIGYVIYFLYLAAYVMRDFIAMMNAAVLPRTPAGIIGFTLMSVVAYIVYLGIETIGRMAEIFAPYMLLFTVAIVLLCLMSGEINLHNLLPVLGDGWHPIIKDVFPAVLGFPIGEMPLILMVLMAYIKRVDKGLGVGMAALGTGTFLLIISIVLQISVLTADGKARASFPLLNVARLISTAEFLERIEPLVVFLMMLGILLKISVFTILGVQGLEAVVQVPYRHFSFPISMIVAFIAIVHAKSFTDHIIKGTRMLPTYFHMPFQVYIPAVLFIILLIKHRPTKGKVGEGT
ncbi:GerAB/ArcD/ProY family transporter [Paenibacillus glycanilyticus]|uniref:Germination protein GerKB n=1 Tax=Paenibacillus glycanilyticus TaxID=126569 RepID=A0ABQ6G8S3_9BACL|nr:endospore germination permease [Paenibacillus glycanilyticus]GLX67017.1 germination protein GerKB [Paenibacillus glycanilyticus]